MFAGIDEDLDTPQLQCPPGRSSQTFHPEVEGRHSREAMVTIEIDPQACPQARRSLRIRFRLRVARFSGGPLSSSSAAWQCTSHLDHVRDTNYPSSFCIHKTAVSAFSAVKGKRRYKRSTPCKRSDNSALRSPVHKHRGDSSRIRVRSKCASS
jgi:hypothetical protein